MESTFGPRVCQMADLVGVKLVDGTARTVRELFTGRKCGLDYCSRNTTWAEPNITKLFDKLDTRTQIDA